MPTIAHGKKCNSLLICFGIYGWRSTSHCFNLAKSGLELIATCSQPTLLLSWTNLPNVVIGSRATALYHFWYLSYARAKSCAIQLFWRENPQQQPDVKVLNCYCSTRCVQQFGIRQSCGWMLCENSSAAILLATSSWVFPNVTSPIVSRKATQPDPS